MCKLERTNDKIDLFSTLKITEKKIKLENVYLLYIIFWLKLFIYQDLKYKFSKVSTELLFRRKLNKIPLY